MTGEEIEALNNEIFEASEIVRRLNDSFANIIVGQRTMMDRLLIGLLTKGHILLEGMPGLAKTLAIKTLANAIDAPFSRIQFTPDLLPSDVIGTLIYNPTSRDFEIKKGPIFSNFVLADEINRAPAKVQSALLEAMQERQVTIGDQQFKLEEPFLVLATQNPIEQEGTYPLPEAQLDRFMLKVKLDYPDIEEERIIIRRNLKKDFGQQEKGIVTIDELLSARDLISKIYMDEKIEQYILDIVFATRYPEKYGMEDLSILIEFGGSPRASINLATAAKGSAFLNRRGYVIPEDVRNICKDVLRHRIGLTYEAEAEEITQEHIIDRVLNAVEVP